MPANLALHDLVYDLCLEGGIPTANIDVSDLENFTTEIPGIHISSVVNARQVLENLMETYLFDAIEDGRFIRFIRRGNHNIESIPTDDFILNDDAQTYEKTRVQDVELPDRTKVSFADASRDYNVGSVDGHTVTGLSTTVKRFTTICVMNQGYAKGLADAMTHQAWIGRDSVKMSLPITYRHLKPGDTFAFATEGSPQKSYKIAEITIGSQVEVDAVAVSLRIDQIVEHVDDPGYDVTPVVFGASRIVFADIPLLTNDIPESNWSPRVIAQQNPWPGGVSVYQDDFLGGYNLNTVVPVPSIIGELTAPLQSGVTGVWDEANTVQLQLYDAAQSISPANDLAVLNGANPLGVLTPSGEWEILQFVNVDITGADTYTLSRLLRGQLGTEFYMGSPTPAGSIVFIANPLAYSVLEGSNDQIGIERTYRYGPSNKDFTDTTYDDINITPRGVPLRPYSPVHLSQSKQSNGDIDLSWIRRTRFDGDAWVDGTVPLNEEFERYEVDILDGPFGSGSVVRTITVNVTTFTTNPPGTTYTEAQQITDFGSAQSSVNWAVHQISALVGRGTPGVGSP